MNISTNTNWFSIPECSVIYLGLVLVYSFTVPFRSCIQKFCLLFRKHYIIKKSYFIVFASSIKSCSDIAPSCIVFTATSILCCHFALRTSCKYHKYSTLNHSWSSLKNVSTISLRSTVYLNLRRTGLFPKHHRSPTQMGLFPTCLKTMFKRRDYYLD